MRRYLLKTLFSRMLTAYLTITLGLVLAIGVALAAMLREQGVRQKSAELQRELLAIGGVETEVVQGVKSRAQADIELQTIARHYDALIDVYHVGGAGEHYYSTEKWRILSARTMT